MVGALTDRAALLTGEWRGETFVIAIGSPDGQTVWREMPLPRETAERLAQAIQKGPKQASM